MAFDGKAGRDRVAVGAAARSAVAGHGDVRALLERIDGHLVDPGAGGRVGPERDDGQVVVDAERIDAGRAVAKAVVVGIDSHLHCRHQGVDVAVAVEDDPHVIAGRVDVDHLAGAIAVDAVGGRHDGAPAHQRTRADEGVTVGVADIDADHTRVGRGRHIGVDMRARTVGRRTGHNDGRERAAGDHRRARRDDGRTQLGGQQESCEGAHDFPICR